MSWNSYWVQWVVQNVLPPSVWTLAGLAASHAAHRSRAIRQHAEQLAQRERHHEELKAHVTKAVTAPVIEQMTDKEFEQQLRALMRRNPRVLEAFLRAAARRHGQADWLTSRGGLWPR